VEFDPPPRGEPVHQVEPPAGPRRRRGRDRGEEARPGIDDLDPHARLERSDPHLDLPGGHAGVFHGVGHLLRSDDPEVVEHGLRDVLGELVQHPTSLRRSLGDEWKGSASHAAPFVRETTSYFSRYARTYQPPCTKGHLCRRTDSTVAAARAVADGRSKLHGGGHYSNERTCARSRTERS